MEKRVFEIGLGFQFYSKKVNIEAWVILLQMRVIVLLIHVWLIGVVPFLFYLFPTSWKFFEF